MGLVYTKTLFLIYLKFTFIWGSYVLSGYPNLCQHLALSVEVPILFKKQKQTNKPKPFATLVEVDLQNKSEDLTVIQFI